MHIKEILNQLYSHTISVEDAFKLINTLTSQDDSWIIEWQYKSDNTWKDQTQCPESVFNIIHPLTNDKQKAN